VTADNKIRLIALMSGNAFDLHPHLSIARNRYTAAGGEKWSANTRVPDGESRDQFLAMKKRAIRPVDPSFRRLDTLLRVRHINIYILTYKYIYIRARARTRTHAHAHARARARARAHTHTHTHYFSFISGHDAVADNRE